MTTRLLAGGLLLVSALVAWLAITFTVAARVLQAAIALSILYVGYLAWLGWRMMRRRRSADSAAVPGGRPWITIVVPARNEAAVIGNLVGDLGRQEYADGVAPRYDVLVVDDGSVDDTYALARREAEPFGERIRVIRREPGSGPQTKGAVLRWAQDAVRGEVAAALDADSRVDPGFLEAVRRAWDRNPWADAVQVQRRSLPAPSGSGMRGWVIGAQDEELLMDMASQCGRWSTAGSAELRGNGMFVRREALERVGGWSETALTEDLELSSRLVADGGRVGLAPEADVREEAVTRLTALWHQRMRWAEGSMRRLIELGPAIVGNRALPFDRRLDVIFFVTEFVVPPLFVTAIAASLATIVLPQPADWTVPASLFIGYGAGTFLLAAAGLAAQGVRGAPLVGRSARGALFLSHWLVIVPAALIKMAVGPRTTTFVRTPRAVQTDDAQTEGPGPMT